MGTVNMAELVGDGAKIEPILTEIFHLMDENSDGHIDESEGVAIGVAMGENEEQAKKSLQSMTKDMDEDKNKEIELPEWLDFYKKSLKDAALDEVLAMLEEMKKKIAESKGK